MFIVQSQDSELLQHSLKTNGSKSQVQALAVANFLHTNIVVSHMKALKTSSSRKAKKNKCQTKYGNVQGRSNVFKLLQNTSRSFKVLQKEKEMPSVLESSDWLLLIVYSCCFARRKQSS